MLNLVTFEPGATVPAHSHPHEQFGIVLRGMQALVIDGVAHELEPMDGYVLPGGIEHSAYCGPEGATVLDVFCPVREDYRERVTAFGLTSTRPGTPATLASIASFSSSSGNARPDQRGEVEPSGADVLEQDRHRDGGVRRAVDRAHEVLVPADQLARIEIEPPPRGRQADDHRRPAVHRVAQREQRRRRIADGVERVVDAGEPGLEQRVRQGVGLHGVRRARAQRLRSSLGQRVDRRRWRRLRRGARPGSRTAPRRRPRPRARTRPRGTRAAKRTAPTPVRAAHPRSAACSSGTPPPVGRATRSSTTTSSDSAPVAVPRYTISPSSEQPGRAVDERAGSDRPLERKAGRRPPAQAVGADAARGRPREHDLVTRDETLDRAAHLLDDPGALVAQHDRRRPLPLAAHRVQVGAADADRGHAHDHVAGPRLLEIELDDLEGPADPAEDPGAALQRSERRGDARAVRDDAHVLQGVVDRGVVPVGVHRRAAVLGHEHVVALVGAGARRVLDRHVRPGARDDHGVPRRGRAAGSRASCPARRSCASSRR